VARVRRLSTLGALLALAALAALGAAACERPPSADKAKVWTPDDHDREDQTGGSGGGAQAAAPRGEAGEGGGAAPSPDEQLAAITWEQQCFACHGPTGHGDGPTGPMVRASDLTREDWQAKVSDAEIAATITQGRGKMPKFDLPPKVVDALVARIRASRGR
jgi:mono/diheme cytochrome c family protein